MAECKETEVTKRKHADFMLRIAEKIFSLAYVGLLGAPAMAWITKSSSSDFVFSEYLLLLCIGGGLGVYLMKAAFKCHADLDQVSGKDCAKTVSISVAQSFPECLDADKPICIVIERGAMKISIRIG